MVSLGSLKISFPFFATVLIFFIAGLLSIAVRAGHSLGGYRIPWRPAFSSHLMNAPTGNCCIARLPRRTGPTTTCPAHVLVCAFGGIPSPARTRLRLSPRRRGCYPASYGGSRHLPAGSGVHLPARTLPASAPSLARSQRGHRPAARSSRAVPRPSRPPPFPFLLHFPHPRSSRPFTQPPSPPPPSTT